MGSEITDAVLADLDHAPIEEGLRQTIRFVQKLTATPHAITAADARAVLDLGVSRQALEDAVAVAFCFNLITRLADAFGWEIPAQSGFDASAKSLLDHGYLMPLRGKPAGKNSAT